MIRMADNQAIAPGQQAFNYYDMKPGYPVGDIDYAGWFTFRHNDGTSALLNGERICSLETARKKGWL